MRFNLVTFLLLALATSSSLAGDSAVRNIQEYDSKLPLWGVTWKPGEDAVSGYYPSFYTGFAMRSEFPQRIHVQLARGNQTRVSVILDDQTVRDYVFDLVHRDRFYRAMANEKEITLVQNVKGAHALPQLSFFSQIVQSPEYGIEALVHGASQLSDAQVYAGSLRVLTALNPGRVFSIRLDLRSEFLKWQEQIRTSGLPKEEGDQLLAINTLVWGRVNFISKPTSEVLAALDQTAGLALGNDEAAFIASAVQLFQLVTGSKYQFRVLNEQGQWQSALQCESVQSCWLVYPEFTAIYPTGSVMSSTKDQNGNKINTFATPGLWQFLSRGDRHDVDNIRDEAYYGWAPKMDYEEIGNGFHNPAVRFAGVSKDVKTTLGIPESHSTLWSVKRGGVSHGCSRLPVGHLWEMRQIFPVENSKMTQIPFFGSHPQDFDLYDVDGDGTPEIMGVEYFISYGLQGASGLANREGADLEINKEKRLEFYTDLYGKKNVFTALNDGSLVFQNPSVSVLNYRDFKKKKLSVRMNWPGEFRLYEQTYEQDKVQFYATPGMSGLTQAGKKPRAKRIVRLMGRTRGCAPTADKNQCGEDAFVSEAKELVPNVK